jgi:hypothetical protein
VKFSYRQILASAAGAVIAALIASSFGVTGTIVGVAIGSMAATMGTALVSQSIDRGHKVVKQAVVRVPEGPTATLLRRMGGTGAAGGATSSVDGAPKEPEPTEVVGAVGEETTEMLTAVASGDATERVDVPAADVEEGAAVTERFDATTVPLLPTEVLAGAGVMGVTGGAGVATAAGADDQEGGRRFTWKAFAGTAAIVFVLALGLVTAVELIANKPLASIFGGAGRGPTLKNIFTPGPPATSTTTTTSTPSTTSTSTGSTTTTIPSTSTTPPSSTTTTSTNLKSTTTTTTTTTTTAGP